MSFVRVVLWLHVLTMTVVLGGYIFLSCFWWPVLKRATEDAQLQLRIVAQTLRRFFTTVVLP